MRSLRLSMRLPGVGAGVRVVIASACEIPISRQAWGLSRDFRPIAVAISIPWEALSGREVPGRLRLGAVSVLDYSCLSSVLARSVIF